MEEMPGSVFDPETASEERFQTYNLTGIGPSQSFRSDCKSGISFSARDPPHFYSIGLVKGEHKLATYMSALAQFVGLSHFFEWENGVEMGFELACIGQVRHFSYLLA